MDDNDRTVPANSSGSSMLTNLMTTAAAFAVSQGVSFDDVAAAAGLEPSELVAAPERVPDEALTGILTLVRGRLPDRPVGIETIMAAPLTFLGPLEPLARHVPDLRTGITTMVEFRSILATEAQMAFIDEVPGPMVRFDPPADPSFRADHAEMAVSIAVRAVTEVLGLPSAIRAVWLAHEPFGSPDRYESLLSTPVRFGAPADAILFHANRLDAPVGPDAGARLRVLRSHLEIVRARLDLDHDPIEVRHIRDAAALNAERGEFGAPALAARLAMSERTLQRRLAAHGRSVRSVLDEVRGAAARELLADDTLSVLEVALMLGYSTDAAFRRAFKRWTGQSPAAYRRAGPIS